jgi:hypothetical protein
VPTAIPAPPTLGPRLTPAGSRQLTAAELAYLDMPPLTEAQQLAYVRHLSGLSEDELNAERRRTQNIDGLTRLGPRGARGYPDHPDYARQRAVLAEGARRSEARGTAVELALDTGFGAGLGALAGTIAGAVTDRPLGKSAATGAALGTVVGLVVPRVVGERTRMAIRFGQMAVVGLVMSSVR